MSVTASTTVREHRVGIAAELAGSLGISVSGIMAWAAKGLGMPDKLAHGLGLAWDLSSGLGGDGFEWENINRGSAMRHAMMLGDIDSPLAHLGGYAAVRLVGPGYAAAGAAVLAGVSYLKDLIGNRGSSGLAGNAAVAAGGLGTSVLGSLKNLTLGLLPGLAALGFTPIGKTFLEKGLDSQNGGTGIGSMLFRMVGGNRTAELRGALGMSRVQGGFDSPLNALPNPCYFEDLIFALMISMVKDSQEKIEGRARELLERSKKSDELKSKIEAEVEAAARVAFGDAAVDAHKNSSQESRNIEFEIIKNEIQKLTQMQQALGNIMNVMHEQAQNAIRYIKA